MPRSPNRESPLKAAAGGDTVPARRGRPPKQGKSKITVPIVATGKGRGRPKKAPKSDYGGEQQTVVASGRKSKARKKSKAGRPRKDAQLGIGSEDDDRSDVDKQDDEERRPVGRPPTGAINLNIVRTGRGQGRPKKGSKRAASKSSNGTPKKVGRPSLGGVPYVPTGRPRGRPKLSKTTGTKQSNEETGVHSQEELKSEIDDLSKKPGRPPTGNVPYTSTGRPRGRPKINVSTALGDESDGDNTDGYSTPTSDKQRDRSVEGKIEDGPADSSLN